MHRRTLLTGAAASLLAAPAIAQDLRPTTLRFVPQANLGVLDPIWTTATITGLHGSYVFDTLYAVDSAMRPQPQMAEGHEVSADGRLWRIRLRQGLTFHDTTPVCAVDCIASLKRWGAREPFGQLLLAVVDNWQAPDDRTIEIRLTRPFPQLLEALGKADTSFAFIMPERLALTDPNKQVSEMIGSGPYRFVSGEFNSGGKVVYEKFAAYIPRAEPPVWASGGKVAHFARIEWIIIPDSATAAAALQSGEVDWWERPLTDLQPMLAKNADITLQIADHAGRMAMMRLNTLQPPFNDVRLRRAVRLAVQQDSYMRAAQGNDTNLWTTCRSLWPRNTPYYADAGDAVMPGSADRARAALKEAGYNGQTVAIINPTDYPDIGPLGQVTAATLKEIGMTVDLRESDWGTVIQRRASREPVEKGGWSIFHTTGTAVGLANPAMSYIVRDQGPTGWFGWWESAKAEDLVQQWLYAPDEAGQNAAAGALGALALDEAGTVPLGQFYGRTAYRKSITGILPGPMSYPWNVRPV
jgi:peptide/nickel transport system substrate-binding protein